MGQIQDLPIVSPEDQALNMFSVSAGLLQGISSGLPVSGSNLGFSDALSLWLSSPSSAWGLMVQPSISFSYGSGFGFGLFVPVIAGALIVTKMMQRR
jgi:hypothetical protein